MLYCTAHERRAGCQQLRERYSVLLDLLLIDQGAPVCLYCCDLQTPRMGVAAFAGLALLGLSPLVTVFVVAISRSSFLVLLTLGR